MGPEEVFALTIVIIGVTLLGFPLVRALADRIRPRALDTTGLREEVQALREDVLGELQQARHEIAELSERVDFQERLLAKKTDR
ncbi:MAG: hypothetical protein ABR537_11105 [Gemmatimonadales bacterium]